MANIEDVINFLSKQERAKVSPDRTYMMMRCPICGDPTSRTSANFSVNINTKDNKRLLYQCFRANCRASGYMTPDKLKEFFGCSQLDILMALGIYNGEKMSKKKLMTSKPIDFEKNIIFKSSGEVSKRNEAYFNDRMGQGLSSKEISELRVITNIRKFLKDNRLKINTKYDFDGAIGFLNAKSNMIICRKLHPYKNESRYINYKLFEDDNEEISKYYIMPKGVKFTDVKFLLSPKPVDIHIAEGIFSLLGAYFYNVYKGIYREGSVYVANNGSGYLRTIKELCRMHGFTNINITVYADRDGEIDKSQYELIYKIISKEINVNKCLLKFNAIKEDFGYPSKLIKVKEFEIS